MNLGMISPSHDENGIKLIKELGLNYAEFDVNADDISYLDKEGIKSALNKYGVKLGAVGRWGRPRILSDGTFNRKEQKDEFDLIDMCEYLDCPVYITGCNYVNEISRYSNITSAINYFKSLLDYASGRVKVCVYNCDWVNYVYGPAEWDLINGHLKDLGIKYDPSHAVNRGCDYLDEAAKYGDRFYHVHLKGTLNINGNHLDDPPAGMDMINWGAFISILRKFNYSGMVSLEPHSAVWSGELGEQGLKYSIDYFKKLLFID